MTSFATPLPSGPVDAAAAGSDPFADRRSHPRVRVAMPAFLGVGAARLKVQVVDLSAGGAKLHGSDLPPLTGRGVALDVGHGPQAATVRWQDGPFLGLAFDAALDPRDVAALAARSEALSRRMAG